MEKSSSSNELKGHRSPSLEDENFYEETFKLVDILKDMKCPLLGEEKTEWLEELFFRPGINRLRLLQWIYTKMEPNAGPLHPPTDTKECLNELVSLYNSLGLIWKKDVKLFAGQTSQKVQIKFWNFILDWCKLPYRSSTVEEAEYQGFHPCWNVTKEFIMRKDALFNPHSITFPPDLHTYSATEASSADVPTVVELLERRERIILDHNGVLEQLQLQNDLSRTEDLEHLVSNLKQLQGVISKSKIKDTKPPALPSHPPELVDADTVNSSHTLLSSLDKAVGSISTVSTTATKIQQLHHNHSAFPSDLPTDLSTLEKLQKVLDLLG